MRYTREKYKKKHKKKDHVENNFSFSKKSIYLLKILWMIPKSRDSIDLPAALTQLMHTKRAKQIWALDGSHVPQ